MNSVRLLKKFRYLVATFCVLFLASGALATPLNISFQSKIFKPDGNPLEAANVQFKFSLMNPLSTCVIYSETFSSVDLTGSSGSVVLALGNGTRSYPVAGLMNWRDAFNNSTTSYTCQTSGTYSPALIDPRRLVMQFNDGSGWQTLPPMDINSVPYAMFAESAESVPVTGILQGGASVGQVLKWNGTSWAASADDTAGGGAVISTSSANAYLTITNPNTTPSFTVNVGTGPNTLAAGDDSRIVGAFQSATALSGDLTGALPNPVLKAIGAGGTGIKVTYDTKGRVTGTSGLVSSDVTSALGYTPLANYTVTSADISSALGYTPSNGSNALTSANIFVGNGSNLAEARVLSGDATISNTGILTLNNILWSKIISTPTTLVGYGITDAISTAAAFSGDVSGTSSNISVNRIKNKNLNLTAIASGDILQYNGTEFVNKNIPACGPTQYLTFDGSSYSCVNDAGASGTVTAVTAAATVGNPITIGGTGTAPTVDLVKASASANGYLASSDFTAFNSKMSSSLTSAQIFVGNGSNLAEARVLSGDASISNLGILTVNNVAWNKISATPTTVTGYGITDALTTSTIHSGDLTGTYNALALAPIGAGGTGYKVTYDTKGRVTGTTGLVSADVTTALGYTPLANYTVTSADISTALGFTPSNSQWSTTGAGIYYNSGNVGIGTNSPVTNLHVAAAGTSIVKIEGTNGNGSNIVFANSTAGAHTWSIGPAGNTSSSAAGSFIFTDNTASGANRLVIDGAGNVGIANPAPLYTLDVSGDINVSGNFKVNGVNIGAGGGVASVTAAATAGNPITIGGTGTAPTVDLAKATAAVNGYLASSDFSTFNSKMSSSLTSANIFVGNGSNLAEARVLSGDASISNLGILSLTNSSTARSNLGLGTAAVYAVPVAGDAAAGQVVKGDDSRLIDARSPMGTASGDLAGSYPNPALAAIGAGGTGIKVTYDTKGRVTGTTGLVSSDVTTALGYTPSNGSNALTSANIFVGNGSNLAEGRVLSGDATISNTGILTLNNILWSKIISTPTTLVGYGITDAVSTATVFSGDVSGTQANISVNKLKGKNVNIAAIASGDILQYNGTDFITKNIPVCGANQYLTFNGSSYLCVNDAGASGTVTAVTAAATVGNPITIGGTGTAPTVDLAKASASANGYLASSDFSTFNSKMTSSLTSAQIFVGNGSNLAEARVLSGDASISNLGILSLATLGAGGAGSKITYDTKGRVLSAANLNSADITTALGYTPTNSQWITTASDIYYNTGKVGIGTATPNNKLEVAAGDIMIDNGWSLKWGGDSARIVGGSSSNFLSFITDSTERLRIDSTGKVGIGVGTPLFAVDVSGDVNITGNFKVNGVTIGAGNVTSVTAAATAGNPITIGGTGTAPTIGLAKATAAVNGYLGSSDFSTFNSKMTSSLTSTQIFVGNGSNLAEARVLSGDATISNTGILSLATVNAGGTGTKITYDTKGRVTSSTSLNSSDVTTALGYTPSNGSNALTSANIFVGNGSNLAEGRVLSGDATISNTGVLTLTANSVISTDITNGSVSNAKINDVAWSKVTGTPTTLLGYGITDASSNALTSGSIFVGNGSNLAQAQVLSGDATIVSSGVLSLKAINAGGTGIKVTYDTKGRVTGTTALVSSDVTTALGYTPANSSTALTSTQIFVGNGSNIAEARVLSGDATISNLGILSLSTTGVSAGTYSKVQVDTKGRVIASATLNSADITSALGYTPSAGASQWVTASSDIYYTTGSVGIGTTSPTELLHLEKNFNGETKSIVKNTNNGTVATAGYLAKSAGSGVTEFGVGSPGNTSVGGLYSDKAYLYADVANGLLLVTGASAPITFAINSAEQMRLTTAGHLGIGTNGPVTQLSNSSTNLVGSDGVGIGNNSLAWVGSAAGYAAGIYNSSTGTSNANGLAVKVANNASTVRALDVSYGAAQATGGTNLFTVLGNGNVGIGVSSPTSALTIQGAAVSKTNIITSGGTVNLALSNNHLLKSVGGTSIALSGMVDGGVYTLVIADTTSRTYSFTGCSNRYFSPTNGPTTNRSTFTIMTIVDGVNTECYITWNTGFN